MAPLLIDVLLMYRDGRLCVRHGRGNLQVIARIASAASRHKEADDSRASISTSLNRARGFTVRLAQHRSVWNLREKFRFLLG